MKKLSILFFLILCVTIPGIAKDPEPIIPPYQIKAAGVAPQGYYLVEVTATVPKKRVSMEEVKKCAVHGVIFKGFAGTSDVQSQRPILSPTVEAQHADYFNAFFANGDYGLYVSAVDPAVKTVKQGKRYLVTGVVSVGKEELRRTLEQAGIVRKLGF